ncbi:6603_t:CDS:2 [Scutellospora calospora]|uniref:6603_t:CDS:1 n=1 Tax=Scutellospora calospora TaxID=85575 RepID=A0ACA9L595_9GLOM|nr:6603_t:CDS:2 [Scutellospora calospora]
MATSKPEAKNLPCIFDSLADKYPKSQLVQCEVKENQRRRHASAEMAVNRIAIVAQHFPELSLLLNSLENYSLCERHYNQIVAKNSFINKLQENSKEKDNNKSKTSCDFEVQVSSPDPELEELLNEVDKLERAHIRLLSENKILKKKLSKRFDDQQDRIEAIIEIAKKERSNLYNDVFKLIEDHDRFHLDNLLKYSLSQWLTVDVIYGIRHQKYVSAINLAASAIKYSIARSKSIIDIDNHFISSGSYNKFIKWQEDLAGECQPFPEGLIAMAFDNEQKGQKNYLDRGHNTVFCYI